MKKLLKKLENKLGYSVELNYDADENVMVLKSGGGIPPEQEPFRYTFNTRSQVRRWIYEYLYQE